MGADSRAAAPQVSRPLREHEGGLAREGKGWPRLSRLGGQHSPSAHLLCSVAAIEVLNTKLEEVEAQHRLAMDEILYAMIMAMNDVAHIDPEQVRSPQPPTPTAPSAPSSPQRALSTGGARGAEGCGADCSDQLGSAHALMLHADQATLLPIALA